MTLKNVALFAACCIVSVATLAAPTIVQERIEATRHLIPLKKLTVGPEDQYQAAVAPDGNDLVFTHKADLIAHLRVQKLATGAVQDLLPLNADSQEPSFAPDGTLVFTYYRFNARGDICYLRPAETTARPVPESAIRCIARAANAASAERLNPFWVGQGEVGFVERDAANLQTRILAVELASGRQRVLAGGRLWSASMVPGGHLLVYNELSADGRTRGLVLRDLRTQMVKPIRFRLPGLTGFPALDESEGYLYFSHFLNDTNGDRVIDGGDNAVVFRIKIEEILRAADKQALLPEQMTSTETSCSFPKALQGSLFVTCAFEGSLDVYRIPASGVIPATWNEPILKNALATSRSYKDRILLLNALETRAKISAAVIEPMLFTNHLLSDDTVAARYYLAQVSEGASPSRVRFANLLRLYLLARERKKAQPSAEISREFASEIGAFDRQVITVSDQPRLQLIVRGLLQTFLRKDQTAAGFYRQAVLISERGAIDPLERYLQFELARTIFSMKSNASRADMLKAYHDVMSASEFSEEAQIFYAFSFLRELQDAFPELTERLKLILAQSAGLPAAVTTLLQSEVAVLKLIATKDEAGRVAIYKDLDQFMIKTKGDYFLRRALYVRAILNFTAAAEFKYLGFVADNWLRYTSADDTEFSYARQVVAESAFDRGYDVLAQKKYPLAQGFFYSAVAYTDNLEAHASYLRTMVAKGERKNIDGVYKNLQTRAFINDNMKFVEALLGLIDAEPRARKDPEYIAHLDQAIEKLQAMTQDREAAVRYLVLGSLNLEKLLRLQQGLDFPAKLLDDAHHNLMLAYDLGRDNDRVRASALLNLGILHSRVRNFGLAARFLALRKRLGFLGDNDRVRFSWLYAEALYHTHQAAAAVDEFAELQAALKKPLAPPLAERHAFFAMAAERYKEAVELYAAFFKASPQLDDLSRAKISLSYGLALFKSGATERSVQVLNEAVRHAESSGKKAAAGERLLPFDPRRLQLTAYGLLGQQGAPSERLRALEKRDEILAGLGDNIENGGLLRVQNAMLRAALVKASDHARAATLLKDAIALAERLDESAFLGPGLFHLAAGYLALSLEQPQLYTRATINKLVEHIRVAYATQKARAPILEYQKLMLDLLHSGAGGGAGATALLTTPEANALKAESPQLWLRLERLQTRLAFKR